MAFWNRDGALLPWPLNNNNNNAPNPINNNNNANNMNGAAAVAVGGVGGMLGGAPPLAPAPPIINPMARAAVAAGARVRRGVRGVVARGWAPHARRQSETSTAREYDEIAEGMRTNVGEEVADRFARLKSNQHLAHRIKRTGAINLARAAILSDEREAAEKALLDRYVACMEKAVGVEGEATEADLMQELRAWMDRVRREHEQNAEARTYLLARREELLKKEASLTAAARYIEEAAVTMALPPAPKWSTRFNA